MSFNDFKDTLYKSGKSYLQYSGDTFEYIANTNPVLLNDTAQKLFEYTKLNYQRSSRIDKSYLPSAELKNAAAAVREKQTWMVITENWCGDSAQILPVIAKAASLNENIDLRIIARDAHTEIMDLYLTNGTRSIPLLVAFDENGNELFKWGPRPRAAVELIAQLKSEGVDKKTLYEKLHLWYGRNRGAEIDKELTLLISPLVAA